MLAAERKSSLEHLLRYCARPPFALERLSVIRGADGRIARVRYVLPRHFGRHLGRPGTVANNMAWNDQFLVSCKTMMLTRRSSNESAKAV